MTSGSALASTSQRDLDDANKKFWEMLCGSALAKQLGISDRSVESLQRFDQAYLEYYPYLLNEVPVHTFSGRHVLEVGLGYGTLSALLAQSAGSYVGVDIAAAPVEMVNYRLRTRGLPESAVRASILNCPCADEVFDVVVAIGCFHHTGDLQRAVDESWRVLKPGGSAYVMVYNRFSYRQWMRWPVVTLRAAMNAAGPKKFRSTESQRRAYDATSSGQSAPETAFVSRHQLSEIFRAYSEIRMSKQNWGGINAKGVRLVPRRPFLSIVGRVCGLDIYLHARK